MKIVFDEERPLPDFAEQWVEPNTWDPATREYIAGVQRRDYSVGIFRSTVTAHYDRKTRALAIELKTTLYGRFDWRPANRTVLELHDTREAALRRTIAVADDWYHEVEAVIPPERTDAELLAAYHDEQRTEETKSAAG